MILTELKSRIRVLIYDTNVPYRLTDTVMVSWLNLGLNDLRTKRPDARFTSAQSDLNSTYVAIDDLYNYYTYTDSSGYKYLSTLGNITGWIKTTYPVLYFKASSTTNINIYPTSADRTAGTNRMGYISGCNSAGVKIVTADGVAIGGTVTLAKAVVLNNIWDITAVNGIIPCDDTFQESLMYYIVSKWYESDSDDTQDANLSNKYYQKYLAGIKT